MTDELILDNIEDVRLSIMPHSWENEHILSITNNWNKEGTQVYLDEDSLRAMVNFINNYLNSKDKK